VRREREKKNGKEKEQGEKSKCISKKSPNFWLMRMSQSENIAHFNIEASGKSS